MKKFINYLQICLSILFGFIIGMIVSEHYYQKNLEDTRKNLIEVAIIDLEEWKQSDVYPNLHDSVTYSKSGSPWPVLSKSGLEQLNSNIYSFKNCYNFKKIKKLVQSCKSKADLFNEKLSLRNMSIIMVKGAASEQSPAAINYFKSVVQPTASELLGFLKDNKAILIIEEKRSIKMELAPNLLNIITLLMVLVLIWQVWEVRRATSTQAFCSILDRLQQEDVRKARKIILELNRTNTAIDLDDENHVLAAEKVCQTYDAAGIMVNNGMIKKSILIDNWGHSIKRCWKTVQPLVTKYRADRNAPNFWDDFESLAKDL